MPLTDYCDSTTEMNFHLTPAADAVLKELGEFGFKRATAANHLIAEEGVKLIEKLKASGVKHVEQTEQK